MNIGEDKSTIRVKKDVIKNIAIVFLAIMLALTFFSNSIMNKSLPEVATQYVQQGTITEKIRGTGIVETDDPYSVMVSETRTIASVAVNVGDEVTKDQVLFYLEDEDSEELTKAEQELEDLIYKYTVGALTGEMSAQAYNQATSGKVSSMAAYEAQIEAAKQRVKNAQEAVDSIAKQIAIADGTSSSSYSQSINDAKLALEEAQIALENAKTKYNDLKAIVDAGDGGAASANNELALAELELANAKQKYENYQTSLSGAIEASLVSVVDAFKGLSEKYQSVNSGSDIVEIIFNTDGSIKNADALNDWITLAGYDPDVYKKYTESFKELTEAKNSYAEKKAAAAAAKTKSTDYNNAKSKLSAAETEYNNAKNKVDEIQTSISRMTNEQSANEAGNQQLSKDLAIKKSDAETELAKAKEDQAQLLLDISKTLDLTNQNSFIAEQREKVEKLKANAVGATVTAPVDGIILSIAKKAGESTSASEALATIQVGGKPMRMSFSVSVEQAKKVTVGDRAEVQNSWYYSDDLSIVLTKIANDPNNPGKGRLLTFNVEGEVSNGESLSISIGQRSRDYDKVVPNSAIREDNRGKFIYIIEEKGTPFGNRYKAKRVDVEVLASDDLNTAISADMDSWAYVITTSNKPIEQGQQVRFSDR